MPAQSREVLDFFLELAGDIAINININDYISDALRSAAEDGTDFDPKTVFKSSTGVAPLKREIITVSRRIIAEPRVSVRYRARARVAAFFAHRRRYQSIVELDEDSQPDSAVPHSRRTCTVRTGT
jgi:hypothetical protein